MLEHHCRLTTCLILSNCICRWWKELNFSKKLPFIRDRVIECYFWILGVYFEPKYFLARRILTKVIAMTSTIDDIYDVYGTLEEIKLFTEAIERLKLIHILGSLLYSFVGLIINSVIWPLFLTWIVYVFFYRWDISAIDQLPEYMKVCYKALLDVYCEMEEKIGEGRSYRIRHAIEAVSSICTYKFLILSWIWGGKERKKGNLVTLIVNCWLYQMKNQVRAYFDEAKWFHQNHMPTMDEYMQISLVTSGYSMLATTSLVGMGDIVTNDCFEWVFSNPKMVRASAVVSRLMDDIVSHKVWCYFSMIAVIESIIRLHKFSKHMRPF